MSKQSLKLSYLPTTEYNGENAGDIIFEAINTGVMLSTGNAMHLLDVAHKVSVTTLAEAGIVSVPYNCTFVGGNITTIDRVVEPVRLSVMKEFCVTTLWSTWYADRKRQGIENAEPALSEFVNYVVAFYLNKVKADIDNLVWNANTASLNPTLATFDGLIVKALADATVIDVPTPVVLTSANILAELAEMITLVPSAVLASADFKIYMNTATALLYQIAIASAGTAFAGATPTTAAALTYLSHNLVVVPSMPANTMYATRAENIVIAMDLTRLENTVKVVDMRSTTADDKLRIRIDYNLDVNHLFGTEVVLYSI